MATGDKQKSVVIVGAGVGGVATAARLAKGGFKVTVVEKNNFTGGRCSLIHHKGYRFDQGPSLLLLPKLFRETFADLDTTLEAEGVKLMKCEPNYTLWFEDGESFELSTDTTKMKTQIEKYEGVDGFERYLGFLQESHRHYELSVAHVLRKNFTSIFSLMGPAFMKQLSAFHPFESIYNRASIYFWTERLRRVFTFGSMYMGMSPFDAPGTYSLLQYTELAEGIWYPEGGFHKVVGALVNVGRRLGVTYRLSSPVSSVNLSTDQRRATGVTLESGEELTADIVIINADLVYAYNNLLPPSSQATSLSKRPSSCSSISFYWSLNRIVPELKTHNIFVADAYRESFDDIFEKQSMPDEPSFYVNVPSRVDPTAAPAGCDAVVVLVPVGHLLDPKEGIGLNPKNKQDWDSMIQIARHTVLRTISTRLGIPSLESAITHEIINQPATWQEKFNLDKGAILGLSHSFFNVLSFRPRTRHPKIKGCFFVGASTHPGTGVPICLAGAKITSTQVFETERISVPWDEKVVKTKSAKRIDRVQTPGVGWMVWLAVLVLVVGVYFSRVVPLVGAGAGFKGLVERTTLAGYGVSGWKFRVPGNFGLGEEAVAV